MKDEDYQHVLLLAPTQRDAALTSELLSRHSIRCTACGTMSDLTARIDENVGCALIAEERLTGDWRTSWTEFLKRQPAWSDLPILVLTARDELTSAALGHLQEEANVTRISRPIKIKALVSLVQACLRDRERQLMVRGLLASIEDREQRFRQLADSMPNIVFSATADGALDYVNKHAYDYIGRDLDLLGDGWVEAIHAEDRDRTVARWQQAIATGTKYQVEFRIRHAETGEYRWHITRSMPARDRHGEITRWFGSCTDIHDQKRHQKRLNEALDQAAAASVAKSEFIANMSHEIRTPMTAVLGYADLLSQSETDPEKLEYLRTIERNGKFLTDIINDILDLSKIEAGKMTVAVEPLQPHAVVQDVYSMMHGRAREKNLAFSVEFRTRIPKFIRSDEKRIRQILINLTGNAIKFTEQGSVKLVLEYKSGVIRFMVQDTGIGMSIEQRKRLFQAFTQGDASVDRRYGGTGLGLAISQRLAGMLGGRIEVESQPNQGSCFQLSLDVDEDDCGALFMPSTQIDHENVAGKEKLPKLDCRVLVVDDRRDVRLLAGTLLRRAGATVEFAEDGLEGSQLVKALMESGARLDLVLMDMQMPRMDGYEASKSLREMGFTRPIVALTADAMQGDMDRCIASGCNAYLSKPIDATELIQLVAALTK